MSREQRRSDRRTRSRNAPPSSRRTPVRPSGGRSVPWVPILVAAGTFAMVLLVAYLIVQSMGGDDNTSASEDAEQDSSPDIPGVFYPSQGRGHFSYTFSTERAPTPFCDGVPRSAEADAASNVTPQATASADAATTPTAVATATVAAQTTPETAGTAAGTAPAASPTVATNCYNSNPPSSGRHLGVQRNIDIGGGAVVNIPADPDVYPHDVEMPRESIPHILEHAGVFVGWNCAEGDTACEDVVADLEDLVNDRIDNHNDRVVMARDTDLPVGEVAVAGWTRVLNVTYQDYDRDAFEEFISVNECRFDPERFCS